MAGRMDSLTKNVQEIKGTLHHLSQRFDNLSASFGERFNAVEQRFDQLSASVGERFNAVDQRFTQLSASIDERFGQMDVAIREQREYTEFAYGRMVEQMQLGFGRLEGKMDDRFAKMDDRFAKMDERFGRFERKLDALIDARPARRRPKRGR